MNLTGRGVYQKGQKRQKKSKPPTAKHKRLHARLRALGCIIDACQRPAAIHHCLTGAGGRKDHMKVLALCHHHHQGEQGIHTLSRRVWEPIYGTETDLMIKQASKLLSSA